MRKSIPMPQGTEKPGRRKPPRTHRNEFPTGYSLAGRSPALPASASPAELILQHSCPLLQLSHGGVQFSSVPVQSTTELVKVIKTKCVRPKSSAFGASDICTSTRAKKMCRSGAGSEIVMGSFESLG